ncbi:hypothetical protein FIBSPDRAFT_1039645 [Athelia psychrophila]|uniref:Uncharacterized protein n=1 Tax=Athelia psychrophila TaxID=1759441 RepID=A0A166RQS7_9AGAM|nr:hypothetical protein FIBSPDRAFT_1039645 [Fibularhizoctonia sp. CBS 109695]
MQGLGALVMMGNAAKSYLFLLRVRAVYGNSKLATACVVAGVSVLVGMRIVGTFLVHTSHPLGSAGPCDVTGVGPLSAISAWFNVGYDTCIFIAISARLTSHTTSTTNTLVSFIRGHGLPRTMRHLLQDGQLYYFTTLIFMLFSAISNTSPKINPIFQVVATIPAAVMESNMACAVFRAMILLRSPDVQQANNSRSNPACGFELDTSVELHGRTMDMELQRV